MKKSILRNKKNKSMCAELIFECVHSGICCVIYSIFQYKMKGKCLFHLSSSFQYNI